MSASSMAIDTNNITTFANNDVNSVADMNTTISEIVTKFNAALETATGHYHDGIDARLIFGGLTGFTAEDLAIFLIMRSSGGRL